MSTESAPPGATQPIDGVIQTAEHLYDEGSWSEGHALLLDAIAATPDPLAAAPLRLALVDGYSEEDWMRGAVETGNGAPKHEQLDAVDAVFDEVSPRVRADARYQRGMALHIDFVMAEGDPDREIVCFTEAIELYEAAEHREGVAMATAMAGIFHHVDRLDRETARPLLQRAYELAPPGPSYARSEATRHLGQIAQELGDPVAALPILEESLHDREGIGRKPAAAAALHAIAYARLEAGDLDGAADHLARAREVAERYDGRFILALVGKTEADLELARVTGPGLWRRTHP